MDGVRLKHIDHLFFCRFVWHFGHCNYYYILMSLCKCFQINVIGETSGFLLLRENWEESGKTPLQKVQQSAFDPPPQSRFQL